LEIVEFEGIRSWVFESGMKKKRNQLEFVGELLSGSEASKEAQRKQSKQRALEASSANSQPVEHSLSQKFTIKSSEI
jgi:hypothetical protein